MRLALALILVACGGGARGPASSVPTGDAAFMAPADLATRSTSDAPDLAPTNEGAPDLVTLPDIASYLCPVRQPARAFDGGPALPCPLETDGGWVMGVECECAGSGSAPMCVPQRDCQ